MPRRRARTLALTALLLSALLAGCKSAAPRADAVPAADVQVAEQPVAVDMEKDVNAALFAGEFAWQDGRAKSAATHYLRAAKLSSNPEIAAQATRIAIAAKEWEMARDAAARWRELDPEAEGLAQTDAALALLREDHAAADSKLAAFLADGEEGRKRFAQVLLGGTSPEAALAAVERLSARPALPGGAESLVLLSQVAQQLKREVLATAIAEKAVTMHPKSPQALTWRGHLKLRGGDKAAAKADFEEALRLDPKNRELRLTQAAVMNELGDAREAVRLLEPLPPDDDVLGARAAYAARADDQKLLVEAYRALEALPEPRREERIELLGQLAELADLHDEAREWYEQIPRGERYVAAQMRIAVILDDQGKHDEALKHLRDLRAAGIDADERLADTYLLEGELLLRQEKQDAALAAYAAGLTALPDDRRILYGRAIAFEQIDRVDEALADLRRIVEMHPNDADAMNALGYTLADRTDRYEEALALIEKAHAAKPEEAAIIDSLGWVQFRMKRYDEAIANLRRAYALQPDAEIAAHLGEALWVAGQKDEARRIFGEAKKKDADNRTLNRTIERLKP